MLGAPLFAPPIIPGVEFERELGRGAYSVVFRARLEGAPCAVKLPRVRGSWTRWIYREAVGLARVREPGLPTVLEVGEVDDLPYLVMELVEGQTLADVLAQGPLSPERTLDLARELGRTLAAVHDAGLVHRDVKPANIVLDETGRVRLVDFGFATSIERLGSTDAAGTPAYAAPEQLTDPSRVDGRADLHALGRVLHECSTGFRATDSESGPRALVERGIAPAVAQLLDGLLAHDPDDRYPDARAFLADVARVGAGQPPRGPALGRSAARVRAFVARHADLQRSWQVAAGALRGSGSVVVVRGDRGSGKSRLLDALVARWPDGASVAVAACHEGDAPLATLRRILESFLGDTTSPDPRAAAALRAAAGDDLAPLALLIAPSCGTVLALPAGQGAIAAGTFAEGAAELVVRLARQAGPLVVAVDDLQWVDPISQEVLVCLAHRAHHAPLALVLATRPDGAPRIEGLAAAAGAEATTIDLAPLDLDQIGALVASYLATDERDETVLRRISLLSDHTPLGVLEVLGALLDRGALRPHRGRWKLDATRAAGIALPEGTGGLVARRLSELPPATHAVLEIAAVLGAEIPDGRLARAVGLAEADVAFALADARRAGLVERRGTQHRFVHDTVRESLLQSMPEAQRRGIHQRIAEILEDEPDPTVELLCAKATHYAEGGMTADPRRGFAAALAAAHASIDRFDNETGLRFFAIAEAAAPRARASLTFDDHRSRAEAHLRLAQFDDSRRTFEAGLGHATTALERAQILARIAWVHQTAGEPERAWTTLERAFELIGARLPREDVASAAITARHVLARGARVVTGPVLARRRVDHHDRATTALLCDLHYQNARLALEHGKPMRLLESALQAMDLGERAGAARAHAGARAMMGVVLTAIGRGEAGAASVARAAALARAAHDPVTEAFCAQIRSVIALWGGDFERGLRLVEEAVEVHGHWLEVTELCLNAGNIHLIHTLRGRPRDAHAGISRARERLSRSPRVAEPLAAFVAHRERAARVILGLDGAAGNGAVEGTTTGGMLHLGSWGSRMLALVEADDLGPRFEALVREFEAERHNPRTAHLVLLEYYIAVAHARVEQLLHAPDGGTSRRIPALRRAVDDLKASAKLPFFRTHLLLVTAHLAWFEGRVDEAWKLAHDAERLASEQSCPWVLHGVARARAHWLREAGHHASALDHARTAHALATEHGAASRAARVAREFGLVPAARSTATSLRSTSSHRSHRARRQLAALLQIARSGGSVERPEARGEAVLDELLRAADGERAELLFQPDPAVHTRLVLGRTRRGESSFAVEGWRQALLHHVRDEGEPWPGTGQPGESAELPADVERVVVLPLQLYGRTVGAVGLERSPAAPGFTQEDRELLGMLAQQVPLALEIGRLLGEREQLQASLQQVQKMEAVGQLAGGVAHDFNNMLTAIQSSLDAVAARIGDDGETMAELAIASDAVDRAAQLTRRLLTFSRHQPVRAEVCDPNELLTTIAPMVRRLIGSPVTLELDLEPTARAVTADRSAFEQALVNLAVNARDAMPAGGRLTVSTRNVRLDEGHVRRGAAAAGEHVTIAVRDEGHGMSPDVVARVFEPFYTTKGVGTGTGLGLTMVYAFVKNCGGFIEVQSEAGAGTTFLLHLPRAPHGVARSQPPPPAGAPPPTIPPPSVSVPTAPSTVLVIDDEKLVSRSIQKMLQRSGYRVLVAHDAEQALDLVEKRGSEIGLVIVDVVMPGMSGPELGRRFAELQLPAKLLYVSGFAPENLPGEDEEAARASFLQKPFAPADLLDRVGRLLAP